MITAVLAGLHVHGGNDVAMGIILFRERPLSPASSASRQRARIYRAARVIMIVMMICATLLAVGIKDITPWVMFINAAMITPALPLSWLRWFWWRFNIWGELFGLVISVPLASVIWFGLGARASGPSGSQLFCCWVSAWLEASWLRF